MKVRILPAAAMIVACLQAGALLAQSTPGSDTAATPAPTASPAPSEPPTAAAPSAPPATAPTDNNSANEGKAVTRTEPAKAKSPKRVHMSSQTRHDIEHSLKTGTVPSRYRSQVPKEYQRYIPFER